MDGFHSPDIPAFYSYVLVLLAGMAVARSRVNAKLDLYADRWAFAGTWALFLAYTSLPILLFWFLDYTAVIRDTSLFAALVVTFGYQQIFANGIQGISLPGQSAALWKPFEAWVQRVAHRIEDLENRYLSRFGETVRARIAASPQRIERLEILAFERSQKPDVLETDLAPLRKAMAVVPPVPGAARRFVERLWREVAEREPMNYPYLLRRRGLIDGWTYWQWAQKGRSRLVTSLVLVACMLVAASAFVWVPQNRDAWTLTYYKWRFLKDGTSERDRFRSRAYLLRNLAQTAPDEKATTVRARRESIIKPLIDELAFTEVTDRQISDALQFIMDSHEPPVNDLAVPWLIDALRTRNVNVRLRINAHLLDVQKADYPSAPIEKDKEPFGALLTWIPKADESPGETDRFVRLWKRWWELANRPAASQIEKDLAKNEVVELNDLEFDFGKDTITRSSDSILSEAAGALRRHPEWRISIEGHTDNVGGDRSNQSLSERRAAAVKRALTESFGIEASRFETRGFGRSRPKAPNTTEAGRSQNRRVELRRIA